MSCGGLQMIKISCIIFIENFHLYELSKLFFIVIIFQKISETISRVLCFHWWLSGNESAWNAGDVGSIPGSEDPPGERNDNPLQYPCLGNPITEEYGGLQSLGLQKSWTWHSD